ncbi:hypothetical protein ACHAPT_012135 [Fusarium lateritium]
MARRSLFAVAAFAFGILGTNAGPCRLTATVSSLVETSSTTVIETSSTTLAETLSTALTESSSTTLAETSSTTVTETSTTSQAPACVETQVVVNPSFDDNNGEPWNGVGNIRSTDGPRTGSHNLRFGFFGGGGQRYTFSQALNNLKGNYRLTYQYRVVSWSTWDGSAGFSCSISPSVGGSQLLEADAYPDGPHSWTPNTQVWANDGTVELAQLSFSLSCSGEFNDLYLAIDDVTFTSVCDLEI